MIRFRISYISSPWLESRPRWGYLNRWWDSIAQSFSISPSHRPVMTEILLKRTKNRKSSVHPKFRFNITFLWFPVSFPGRKNTSHNASFVKMLKERDGDRKTGDRREHLLTLLLMRCHTYPPAGTWRRNNVILTSMRRDDVTSTSVQRQGKEL